MKMTNNPGDESRFIDIIKEIEILDSNWGIGQDSKYKKEVISLVKDRSKTLNDLIEISNVFFDDNISFNKESS